MEDLTPEQIVQMGQTLFPGASPEQIIDAFEQYRASMPEGTTNLEIAQVIKRSIDDRKGTRMKGLSDKMVNR